MESAVTNERRSAGRHRDAQRAHPHLQLPAEPRDRPPHRADALSTSTPSWTATSTSSSTRSITADQAEKLHESTELTLRCKKRELIEHPILYHRDPAPETRRSSRPRSIPRAAGCSAIPTETVYGLGANGLNADAVLHIFEAKGRPQDNPLILHIPDASWLARYCKDVPETAYRLAGRFWPGPLTMILPKAGPACRCARPAGWRPSAMRCPDHRGDARHHRAPQACRSPRRAANTSGRPSCTTGRARAARTWTARSTAWSTAGPAAWAWSRRSST